VVLHVVERRERRVPPFEQVRDKVLADARETRRGEAYVAWAKPHVERLHAKKTTLKDLAKELGGAVDSTGTFTRTNRPVQFDAHAPGLFEIVEPLKEGDPGAYYMAGKGLLLFEVDVKVDFDEGSLEKRRDIMRSEIVRARQQELVGALLSRLRERARVEVNEAVIISAQRGATAQPPAI
jgi:hypothetical protein